VRCDKEKNVHERMMHVPYNGTHGLWYYFN
jgi:hypothetical protein